MAVVPFPMNLSPQGPNAAMPWELRTLSARSGPSPLNGVGTSLERPGSHFALRLPYSNLATDRRARLETFALSHRGSANRFHVPVFGWTRRGSFSAPELFTNQYFASGTSGWSANSTTLTVADGAARLTVPTPALQSISQSIAMTQYAPYALRSILIDGRGTAGLSIGPFINAGSPVDSDYSTARGLRTIVRVNSTSGAGSNYAAVINSTSGYKAGDYLECHYASLARCALVDNGPNFLQRSDEIDNAYWTKTRCSTNSNAATSPDGTVTGDSIVEDTANNTHFFARTDTRTSQAEDWCAYGYFRRGSGTRNIGLVIGRDTSNYARAIFDLGGGTIALAAAVTGDATNPRAFIVNAGGGWYFCAVVCRLTATTSLYVQYDMASGTTLSYTGDGASSIHCWRCGAAQSGVPTRGMQTTSAGDADGTLQTGSALHLKGLPASTNGLLLQGDPAEIIIGTTSQLVRTRAPLNTDAAGLGYWQFEPPLRVSPSDNAGVIICNPLCKMMMENNVASWTDRLGGFSDLEFAAVEDTYPS